MASSLNDGLKRTLRNDVRSYHRFGGVWSYGRRVRADAGQRIAAGALRPTAHRGGALGVASANLKIVVKSWLTARRRQRQYRCNIAANFTGITHGTRKSSATHLFTCHCCDTVKIFPHFSVTVI
jgi:hypothetical protein